MSLWKTIKGMFGVKEEKEYPQGTVYVVDPPKKEEQPKVKKETKVKKPASKKKSVKK